MNKLIVCKNGRKMRAGNLGKNTKRLWLNEEYRKHMKEAHKGQKPWNKNKPITEQMSKETNEIRKKKISISLKKAYKEGRKKPVWIGKKYPLSARLKQSKTLKELYRLGIMKSRNKGKASERHKLMQTLDYKLWRLDVFERDKFSCQCCGQIGGKLQAHHIKKWTDYPELRFYTDNGITLCLKCHKEVHKKC